METFSIPAIKFSELNRPKSRNTYKTIKNPIDFVFLKTFINSLLEYPPTNRQNMENNDHIIKAYEEQSM